MLDIIFNEYLGFMNPICEYFVHYSSNYIKAYPNELKGTVIDIF